MAGLICIQSVVSSGMSDLGDTQEIFERILAPASGFAVVMHMLSLVSYSFASISLLPDDPAQREQFEREFPSLKNPDSLAQSLSDVSKKRKLLLLICMLQIRFLCANKMRETKNELHVAALKMKSIPHQFTSLFSAITRVIVKYF